jgi:lysyl-tRNA synthetase class 2
MATPSTVIHGAWYLPERRELDLLLASGRRYRYSEVPADVANGFVEAPSKGGFYNSAIRNRFPCREISAAPRRRYG